ncbi:MAG: hypothetical protein JJU12_02840 [Chlamydiales bacterium]|nr:hypothetical protein [Chlamydiales bacterium]
MKLQEKAILCALLARSSAGDRLSHYLPERLANEVKSSPLPTTRDFSKLLSQKKWVETIHFSWFYEPLKPLKPETTQLFLSLLPQKKAAEVGKMLSLPLKKVSYSPFMRPFLMDEFKRKIQRGVEVVSVDHLPPSDCNLLLNLNKKELLNLIDLLGVHDLSADLRQVVDKEMLRKIYAALSSEQLRFLHYCTKQPMKWISPKLGLPSWDGSKEKLRRMLHGRGLIRLGRALFDEDESFKWHLLHRLDIGRAQIIEKILRQKQEVTLLGYFKNQVLHIAKRYQT